MPARRLRRRRIVRHVVEEHQPGARRTAELQDVEAARELVEAVAVAARVEAEKARDQEADRRLVRDDDHARTRVAADDLVQDRQRARHDADAGLAPRGRTRERVGLPGGILFREALLDLAPAEPLPVAVRDLAETV